jgi:hypothetical protein
MSLRKPRSPAPCAVVTAIVLASMALPASQGTVRGAEWEAQDQARFDMANRQYASGRYAEAAEAFTELAREHPELPSLQRKLGVCYYYLRRPDEALGHLRQYLVMQQGFVAAEDREDVERWIGELESLRARPETAPKAAPTSEVTPPPARAADARPPFRRGFLLLPHAGLQFPVHAVGWFASGLRVGVLLGGHLGKNLSLAGEPALSIWSFSFCQGQPDCLYAHRAVQLELSASLLRHVAWPRAEVVLGPRAGWALVLRHNPREVTYPYVDGPLFGARAGGFLALTGVLTVGVVIDLAYIRAAATSENGCFYGEPDCNEATNTVLGSLTFAALL